VSGRGDSSGSKLVPVTVIAGGDEAPTLAVRMSTALRQTRPEERLLVIAESAPPEPVPAGMWLTMEAVEGERSPGCPCCRGRLDVVAALRLAIERPTPVERILLVLGAERDLMPLTQTLLCDPDLRRLAELDGVVTSVDAVSMATRLAMDLPTADRRTMERVAVADSIVIARATDVTPEVLHRVARTLRTLNRFGYVAAPAVEPLDVGTLIDLRAWHGAPHLGPALMNEPIIVEDDDDLAVTVMCEVEGELDPTAVDEWFDRLISQYASRLLRVQGAVTVQGEEHRVCCRGVGSFAVSHSEDEHPADQRSHTSVVAVVGFGLDADAVRQEFEATRAM